jgi:hypothetical protein
MGTSLMPAMSILANRPIRSQDTQRPNGQSRRRSTSRVTKGSRAQSTSPVPRRRADRKQKSRSRRVRRLARSQRKNRRKSANRAKRSRRTSEPLFQISPQSHRGRREKNETKPGLRVNVAALCSVRSVPLWFVSYFLFHALHQSAHCLANSATTLAQALCSSNVRRLTWSPTASAFLKKASASSRRPACR